MAAGEPSPAAGGERVTIGELAALKANVTQLQVDLAALKATVAQLMNERGQG